MWAWHAYYLSYILLCCLSVFMLGRCKRLCFLWGEDCCKQRLQSTESSFGAWNKGRCSFGNSHFEQWLSGCPRVLIPCKPTDFSQYVGASTQILTKVAWTVLHRLATCCAEGLLLGDSLQLLIMGSLFQIERILYCSLASESSRVRWNCFQASSQES